MICIVMKLEYTNFIGNIALASSAFRDLETLLYIANFW